MQTILKSRTKEVKITTDGPVTIIGEITAGEPGKIELFDANGKTVKTSKTGWQHF